MNKYLQALLLSSALLAGPAAAQVATPGLSIIPQGYCQLTATQLGSAIGLSSCTRASFTASAGSSSNLLVATSVTGVILVGDTLLTGTGITAGGTILSQASGTPGGAGTYVISNTNTTSSATVTTGGIPPNANAVVLQAETASVRYRDDGGAPTTSAGGLLVSGLSPLYYPGCLTCLQFIAASGSPLLNATFYRAP